MRSAVSQQFHAARGVVRYVWTHPSNTGARLSRLSGAAAFQVRTRLLGRPTMTRIGLHSRFEVVKGYSPTESCVVYAPFPDHPEMLAWRRHLHEGDLFVDVGAASGIYSLVAAECGAHTIAIEPNDWGVGRMRRNVGLNGADVDIRQGALAHEAGDSYRQAEHRAIAEFAAQVWTLDEILGDRSCAGVKMDVEGGEHLVLRGAAQALAERRIALIQLEWNNTSLTLLGEDRAPVAALLREAGYELCRPDATGRLSPTDATGFGPDVFARRRA